MAKSKKTEEKALKEAINPQKLPEHIAIIMDGNGRWAKSHRFPRIRGHRQGIRAVRETVRTSRKLGVKVLSLYAFSEENWNRPDAEVKALMSLLKQYLVKERDELMENDIKLITTGNVHKLPADVRKELDRSLEMTEKNGSMVLNLALSYSGRDEIIRAVNRYIESAGSNGGSVGKIDQKTFPRFLDTKGLPDPDLLIRTSGEQRISNFMLWQIAYAEIYVTGILWPDFRKTDLYKAILEFQKRERRFGLISEQVSRESLSDAIY